MPLQKQTLDLQIVGGMNEKVDIYTSTIPDLLSNCRYTKTGSLAKRPGSACLQPSTNRNKRVNYSTEDAGTATMLCEVGNELLRAGAGHLDRVYATSTTYGLVWRDRISTLAATRKGTVANVYSGPSAHSNGTWLAVFYIGYSYSSSNVYRPRLEVYDASSVERICDAHEFGALGSTTALVMPKVFVIGSYVYALWYDVSATTVYVQSFDPVAGTEGTAYAICATVGAGGFDACTDGTNIYVTFEDTSKGANKVAVNKLAPTPPSTYALSTVNVGGADASIAAPSISYGATGGRLHVGYGVNNGGNAKYKGAAFNTAALGTLWGPSIILAPGGWTNGFLNGGSAESPTVSNGAVWSVFSRDEAKTYWVCTDSSGTAATARSVAYPVFPWSKPFVKGTKVYLGTTLIHNSVSGFYVLQLPEWTGAGSGYEYHVEANIAPGAAYPFAQWSGFLTATGVRDVTSISSTASVMPILTGGLTVGTPLRLPAGELATLDWSKPTIGVACAGGAALTGGVPSAYDGSKCSEHGFFYPPDMAGGSVYATAGAGLSVGTYSYKFVYAYTDEQGRIHRSQISNTMTATTTLANSNIVCVIPPVALSNRWKWATTERFVAVEVYRNILTSTSTFYLQGSYRLSSAATSLTITDSTSDASLATSATIYTTGGIKEMVSPPSGTCAWVANQRLWLGGTDDDSVWYTDEFVAEEPPTFRDGFYLPAWEGGRVVAGAALDDKVVVFKQSSIWYTFGDGPDSTGVGAFASFRSLASDVGCVDPRSVVQVPDGILFQSKDGLCLLTRALQVVRIGKPVEDSAGATQATPYSIVGAVAVPGLTEIRFPVDVTGEMRAVVYDYFHGNPQTPIWYRYTWTSPIGGTPKVVAACAYQGVYTWIDSDGYVWQDSTSTWLDTATGYTSTWVTMTAKLSCWNPQKVQGLMRVYQVGVLGSRKTDCDMAVSLWFDYKTGTASQTATFLASALSSYTLDQVAVRPSTQKLQAIQVQFSDATPTGGTIGTGEGVRLAAVSLEVGIRSGLPRLPAGAKG